MIDCECEKELRQADEQDWDSNLVYCSRFCFSTLEKRLKEQKKDNESV
jgi:predicted transcriptional regulator of viral defense system